jgi:glycosyltransferase involved in cell wall biosynthesis
VTIGYLGSSSHQPDLQTIEPALGKILERYPQVWLHFWGCQPSPGLLVHDRVHYTPLMVLNYQDYSQYCAGLEIDIALAPLRDSPFNRSKSPVKFYEYSALGLPGVYSDVAAYNEVVVDHENGLLARDDDSWHEQLSALIENPELRSRLAQQAQAQLRENWLISNQAQQWEQAYTAILAAPRRQVPAQISVPRELLFTLIDQITRHARSLQHQLADSQERQEQLATQLADYRQNPITRLLDRLRQ